VDAEVGVGENTFMVCSRGSDSVFNFESCGITGAW
jgi:hypothetical protein